MSAYTNLTVTELAKLLLLLDQVEDRPEDAAAIIATERDFLVRMVAIVRARGTVLSPSAEAMIERFSLD